LFTFTVEVFAVNLFETAYLRNKTGNVRTRNIEALSRTHICSGKAVSITYSECVSVALDIQQEKRIRLNSICGLSGSTIFSLIIS
jgi:hypothetical protein